MIEDKTLNAVRNGLHRENAAHILRHIGYEIYRGYKFKIRDENTPSASIRQDGYIKDFGGDFSGDLIALLMEYHDMSFREAVLYIATCLGVEA